MKGRRGRYSKGQPKKPEPVPVDDSIDLAERLFLESPLKARNAARTAARAAAILSAQLDRLHALEPTAMSGEETRSIPAIASGLHRLLKSLEVMSDKIEPEDDDF